MKKLLTTTVMAASLSALAMTGCSSTTSTGAVGVDRQHREAEHLEAIGVLPARVDAGDAQRHRARLADAQRTARPDSQHGS